MFSSLDLNKLAIALGVGTAFVLLAAAFPKTPEGKAAPLAPKLMQVESSKAVCFYVAGQPGISCYMKGSD